MAPKPVVLTVDDDSGVSQALTRDLRRQYAQRFRVVRAESGQQALDILRELRLADQEAALLLADHRMPNMTGVEFLEHSLELYPSTKRVLLTAYADMDAAIHAINTVGLDYYLLKPWSRRNRSCTPFWTNCWMTGWRITNHRLKACASSGIVGRHAHTRSKTCWPAITSRFSGWKSRRVTRPGRCSARRKSRPVPIVCRWS